MTTTTRADAGPACIDNYDVAIIGGGPGGSRATLLRAQAWWHENRYRHAQARAEFSID